MKSLSMAYGPRASTCHVLLQALPDSAAKQRLLQLKATNQDKHILASSGKHAWLTQHKSAQKHFNNRATKYAKDTLQTLVCQSAPEELDLDWNRQLYWLRDSRVAAPQAVALFAPQTDDIETLTYSDPRSSDTLNFYINLTRISKTTQVPIPALKQALADIHKE